MAVQKPSDVVTCDICHKIFTLTKALLDTKKVMLEKDGMTPEEVVLTQVNCPHCGKMYPVLVDTEETTAILADLTAVTTRIYKVQAEKRQPTLKMIRKYNNLNRKLIFKRQQLAKKFNGSFYQTEDGKEQLDYHYHV